MERIFNNLSWKNDCVLLEIQEYEDELFCLEKGKKSFKLILKSKQKNSKKLEKNIQFLSYLETNHQQILLKVYYEMKRRKENLHSNGSPK
jgi:hypothetical protein